MHTLAIYQFQAHKELCSFCHFLPRHWHFSMVCAPIDMKLTTHMFSLRTPLNRYFLYDLFCFVILFWFQSEWFRWYQWVWEAIFENATGRIFNIRPMQKPCTQEPNKFWLVFRIRIRSIFVVVLGKSTKAICTGLSMG